jgi:hypothetical protein|tara:strand:- start:385 stop:699 length:315 start_codon:yes stop_codon:yes gene_type:complete
MNKIDKNYYCMVSIKDSDRPEILEIQGVTWFATEELAYQYYMFLKPELREENVFPVEEQDLPSFANISSEDIKIAKTKTRLTGLETGVLVGQGPEYEKAVQEAR